MKNLNLFHIMKATGGKLYFPVDGKKTVDLDTMMMHPDTAVSFPELYGETVRTYKDVVTLYKEREIQNAVIDNRARRWMDTVLLSHHLKQGLWLCYQRWSWRLFPDLIFW